VVLVDTSVWAQHINRGLDALVGLLEAGEVLAHPFVVGELAMGNLRRRDAVLHDLQDLPQALVASDAEALRFIERNRLFGSSLGYIDAHLLAAARLLPGTALWTFDKRLAAASARLGMGYEARA
jgi:predicted nucleic acid-binding protein